MTTVTLYYLLHAHQTTVPIEAWNDHYQWLSDYDYVYGDVTRNNIRVEPKGNRLIEALEIVLTNA